MNWSGYKGVHTQRTSLTHIILQLKCYFPLVVQMRALVRLWCQTQVEDRPPLHSLISLQLSLPHCCRDALEFSQSLAGQGKLLPNGFSKEISNLIGKKKNML